MMRFRVLKRSIIDNVLVPAEAGRWLTVGYQRQREAAEVVNANRKITLYFSKGDIPKSSSASIGSVKHEVRFTAELGVSAAAKVDLSVLKDENATAQERATALAQMSEAGLVADEDMDEFIEIIWQTFMDARNVDMGLAKGQVSNRWAGEIEKGDLIPEGEYVFLPAVIRLSCDVEEQIPGEPLGIAINPVIDGTLDLDGDDVEKTGVTVAL